MVRAIDKYSGGVFNPDDVRILVAAFDGAWRSLLASGITFESDRESKAVRTRSRSTSSNRPAMANVTNAAYVTALCCNTPSQI